MNTAILPVIGAIDQAHAMALSHASRTLKDMKEIDRVVLLVDSPGGTVAGISELAQDIRELSGTKPVVAFIRNRGASAGYWIASQATEIVAEPSAFVGSLGVAAAMVDTSAAAEQAGIKVTLVTSGGVKGAGTPGTPITAEHIAAEQRVVDAIAGMFKADVQIGRKLTEDATAKLFDGQMHTAKAAMALGLVDRIGTLQSVLHVDAPATASAGIVAKTEARTMTDPTAMADPKKDEDEDKPEDPKDKPEDKKAEKPDFPAKKKDDEEDEEDKKKPSEKKESAMSYLTDDIKVLAQTVKEGGCPLTLDSIEAKLTAVTEGEADEIVALEKAMTLGTKLAGMKKFAGSFAATEAVPTESPKASDPKTLRAEWKSKYEANLTKYKGDNMKAFTETNRENAALAKAMVEASTLEWDRIAKANGRA